MFRSRSPGTLAVAADCIPEKMFLTSNQRRKTSPTSLGFPILIQPHARIPPHSIDLGMAGRRTRIKRLSPNSFAPTTRSAPRTRYRTHVAENAIRSLRNLIGVLLGTIWGRDLLCSDA